MKKRVVIVGAGFAGINAAKAIGKNKDCDVTLIDRRNYHLFQPLLYQVATAALSPAEIATPIRSIFSGYSNVKVILGNVESVDIKNKQVHCGPDVLGYDYLVLGCGSKHSYFNHSEWESTSPGLKTLEQATEIRRRILLAYELGEKETNPDKQNAYLTFVVVGGGPTGVELAGAIGEISRHTLEKDFRNIHPASTRVLLIEAGPRILATFDPALSEKAKKDLEKVGVEIWTSKRVTNVTADGVEIDQVAVSAKTVIWAAGVQPSSIGKTLGVPLDKLGRVIIEEDLSLKADKNVFVLGDQAFFATSDAQGLPGLAPVAMQMGKHVGKNIAHDLKNEPRERFRYRDKGSMATIGRKSAVVQINNLKYSGFLAWMTWLFIHIFYLIGFKNRLFVFMDWTWSYITFRRGARLILDKEWRSYVDRSKDGPQ